MCTNNLLCSFIQCSIMASKKPKKPVMSAAFREKEKKEKDKLQVILSTQLHTDMLR